MSIQDMLKEAQGLSRPAIEAKVRDILVCIDIAKDKKIVKSSTPTLTQVVDSVPTALLKAYLHLEKHTQEVRVLIKANVEEHVARVDTVTCFREVTAEATPATPATP